MPSSDQPSLSESKLAPKPAADEIVVSVDGPLRTLRIATRESPLALWQARHIADLLAIHRLPSSIVAMVSGGDVDMSPIDGTRSVGVFTKRIQQALLDDEGDIAVHSMKDLPTEQHPRLVMIASPERETVADCLVSPQGTCLEDLPKSAKIGTGSRRRVAQLLRQRPDLELLPIRGNVQTRLQKMHAGEFDAIVLAAAGIERLAMHDLPRVELPLEIMLPAPGQGALAIEVRREDAAAVAAVSQLNVVRSAACTLAERTLLSDLHGGCLAPIAAYATLVQITSDGITRDQLQLVARVLSLDGKQCLEASGSAALDVNAQDWQDVAIRLGRLVGSQLIDQGAKPLIEAGR